MYFLEKIRRHFFISAEKCEESLKNYSICGLRFFYRNVSINIGFDLYEKRPKSSEKSYSFVPWRNTWIIWERTTVVDVSGFQNCFASGKSDWIG